MEVPIATEVRVFLELGEDTDPVEMNISSAELESGTLWVYVDRIETPV